MFTTHTPEKGGNEEHDLSLLERACFFGTVPMEQIHACVPLKWKVCFTLVALTFFNSGRMADEY